MATYLLLRDNKESGPHTLDNLVKLGFKSYDLVWIEGRSAAWRYPSEIEELKPYAPVAEEQPFDRFYKKATEEKKEVPFTPQQQIPVQEKNQQQYAPTPREEEIKFTPKKSVFVTMPGGQKIKTEPPKSEPPGIERPVSSTPERPINSTVPVKRTSIPLTPIIDDDIPEAEIKYSQPLDEIKEMYVKTLQQRKSKIARKSFLMANMKRAAVIAVLIGVGVLTGFIIRSKSGGSTFSQQTTPASPAVTNSVTTTDKAGNELQQENLPATDQDQQNATEHRFVKQNTPAINNEILDDEKKPILRIRKETMIKPIDKKVFEEEQISPGVDINESTGERNRKVRTDDNAAAEYKAPVRSSKNNLANQVSVSSNDYKIVAFGGIRNLLLTVTNNSKYELDNVIVELQYLKPSEEPLRTENIRFRSIAPNESSTMKIPDTNRGIKVSYKIISIESKHNADDVAQANK